jgi:WD40 repeat protein
MRTSRADSPRPTAPRLDDGQRRSIWRRGMDAVFGYDFFISYSWFDGGTYAAALAKRLEQRGFEVFLDRDDYASGDDWKQVGAWTLRRTGQLILVGSPGALTSAPVARELDIFRATGRRILPIDFGGSLDRLPADAPIGRHLQDEILRIREVPTALADGPSDEVVATIRRTFTLVRQDTKRLRGLALVACVLAALVVAASFFAVYAQHQKTVADANARQTFLRQADLSASIAFRLFGEGRPVPGLKVAREGAPTVINDATPLTPRLALALSRGWSQIQEEAEFRHPDGDIMNAVWSPDGSRAVTATLTDAPRVWSAANGELQAALGSGIRPDYLLFRDPSDLFFSADGRRLATQFGGKASVWETTTWTRVQDLPCEAGAGRYLRLSPDGKSVAALCKDGVHVWDVASKRPLYQATEVVKPDGSTPPLAAFEFADAGDTLIIVDETSPTVRVLRQIASGTPQLDVLKTVSADIQHSTPDPGFVSVHPTRVPTEIVLRSRNAIVRVDLAQDRIVWRMPYASDNKHWFQMLRSIDAIATASLAKDGDVTYRIARGPGGAALYAGRLHFTGQHAEARINAVSFQDDGKAIGVALNTGIHIVALGQKDVTAGGSRPPEEDQQVVQSSPCSGTASEASRITLLADGSRMIAICSGGGARMARLREPPAGRLSDVRRVARFGDALVGLGGTGDGTRFEILDAGGNVTGKSQALGEEVGYWLAAETGSGALFVGVSGTVRSWRPGVSGFVTYGIKLADIRAARFAPDGSRAALLDKNGIFVRLRIGEAMPEFAGRVGGPALPAIDFAIDPTLSVVAFTTADLDVFDSAVKPPPAVDAGFAVVATPGKDTAQFRCRRSQSPSYAAAVFSETTAEPTIYLVQRDRTVEKLALKADAADGTGLSPCPAGLSDAFRPGPKWEINPFTQRSVRIVEPGPDRPGRLIFGGAESNPLELVDLDSQRSITDLTPVSGGNYPLALSADGRYLAALGDTDKTIDIFDVTTGSRLRRIRAEHEIARERAALLFSPANQVLLVRLASGVTVTYFIALRDGANLLEQVKKSGLGPLTDDEKREIYDIRQRLSRPPGYG